MYALIEYAGKQYRIEEGLKLKFPYISSAKEGSKITIDKVLFIDSGKDKKIGKPYIDGAKFDAKIIEHGREKKIVVFKFKRRKGYQKKNGHKQKYTLVEINKMKKNTRKTITDKPKAKASKKNTTTTKTTKNKD
tara:strand:+ start:386 stop:787 length:402 start_codon:yes stop_codon:yes gene_type:complete